MGGLYLAAELNPGVPLNIGPGAVTGKMLTGTWCVEFPWWSETTTVSWESSSVNPVDVEAAPKPMKVTKTSNAVVDAHVKCCVVEESAIVLHNEVDNERDH